MKKFWKWKNQAQTETAPAQRTLFLNGTIAEESWFDDDVTPQLFKDELNGGDGDITVWINSPGGDCVAAAQIYNMLMDYKGSATVKIDGIPTAFPTAILIPLVIHFMMKRNRNLNLLRNPRRLSRASMFPSGREKSTGQR